MASDAAQVTILSDEELQMILDTYVSDEEIQDFLKYQKQKALEQSKK